jgi:hypothetical protein
VCDDVGANSRREMPKERCGYPLIVRDRSLMRDRGIWWLSIGWRGSQKKWNQSGVRFHVLMLAIGEKRVCKGKSKRELHWAGRWQKGKMESRAWQE